MRITFILFLLALFPNPYLPLCLCAVFISLNVMFCRAVSCIRPVYAVPANFEQSPRDGLGGSTLLTGSHSALAIPCSY
jgi:hypothetical protein